MHRLLLFLAFVTATASLASAEKKIGTSKIHLSAELKGFDLHVTEQHELSLTEAWQHPARTYYRSFLSGRFPWSQNLIDVRVTVGGTEQKIDIHRYGYDKIMVRFPTLAAGEQQFKISYTIRDVRGFPDATLPEIRFLDYRLTIEAISLKVNGLPPGAQVSLIERYNREQLAEKLADGSQLLSYGKDNEIESSPVLQLSSEALRYSEGISGYARHFARESRLLPFVGAILLLMLILRFMPARIVLGFVSLFMFIPLAFWLSRLPGWAGYFAARRDIEPRAEYIEHFYGEIGGDLAIAVILFLLAWRVARGIWRGEVADYFLPYSGLVSFLVLLLFMSQDPEVLLMLPLAAMFPVLYSGRQVARFFGADAHQWVEKIIAQGKVSFDELSSASGLAVSRLNRILAALPTHPIAIDHENGQYLSADTLAALDSVKFCNNCGGALKIAHTDLVECPYCRSDYAVALKKKSKPENTPPLVVSTLANFLRAFGFMLLVAFVFLAAFGAFTEIYARFYRQGSAGSMGWAVVITLAVLGALAYAGFAALAVRLTKGKGYLAVAMALALLAPLIWPILALRALSNPRSRFFFGRLDLSVIAGWLAEKKFLTLAEMASRLRSNELDAMNLAHYLTASGELDAVYDRRTNTLTQRSLFRQKAAANSCHACGGVISVLQGARVCRYCGTKAG